MEVNIKKLKKQLYYHPAWAEDQDTFMRFLNQSNFSDEDIVLFGRLYVKYSHMHCFHSNELSNYFNHILERMQIHTSVNLFSKTHCVYKREGDRK